MAQTSPKKSNNIEDDDEEITFREILQFLKGWVLDIRREKKTIYVTTLLFLVLGIAYAYSRTLNYTTTHKVMSYNLTEQTPQMSQLQRLGGLLGQSLNNQRSLVTGDLMMTLLETYPVTYTIASKELRFYKYDPMTFFEYSKEYYPIEITDKIRPYTIGLPARLFGFLNRTPSIQFSDSISLATEKNVDQNNDEVFLNPSSVPRSIFNPDRKNLQALQRLKKSVSVKISGSIITIETTLPDPLASYDLALVTTEVLMQEAVNVEVRKTKEQLQFIQEQFDDSYNRFKEAQFKLADFRDQNKSIASERARIQLQQLQNDYNLAFQLYSASSTQLEEAKIKLREDTPLFSVLDPAKVPLRPENVSRVLIIIQFLILGLFVSVLVATFRARRDSLMNFYRSL